MTENAALNRIRRAPCPVCQREVTVRPSNGRLPSHVRLLCQVGIDGELEYGLCPGSGEKPGVCDGE